MSAFRFSFLGPLKIRSGDKLLLKPPTIKSQSLLAYLVLHRPQALLRENLAGLFWGDRTDRKARRSLATALWHIRSCLQDENFLLSDNYTSQINPEASLWVDVDEFERLARKEERASLQAAISLYHGMFLEGFYDDWVINRRYRLEATYLEVLARLMLVQEASGALAEALTTALRLLENDPLQEQAIRTAMRAFCHLGQRNAALELYQCAEKTLAEELDVLPENETRTLYQAILAGQIEVGPASDMLAFHTPAVLISSRGRNPLDTPGLGPLVDRAEELSGLVQAWEATLAGDNPAILIEGEAGVGKTRLVEEFAGYLRRQGGWVLAGRCYAFERLLSYQPVVEALHCLTSLLGRQDWQDFPSWVLAEVSRLIPETPAADAGIDESLPADLVSEQERLFEGLACFISRVSTQRPLLVVLEDLHWATESTLGLLHYLVRRLEGQSVLLVGTFRPESGDSLPALRELRRQLEKEGHARYLKLQPLSESALVGLVQIISGDGSEVNSLARRLFRETEGNPFYLTEMIKALFDSRLLRLEDGKWRGDFSRLAEGKLPLPGTLRDTILARMDSLDEPAQRALRLASVLGREFDFEPFSLLCGEQDEAVIGILDTLLRSRLIEEGSGLMGRDYAFSHQMIQEVVYASLPRRTRQQTHARAGEALEHSYAAIDSVLDQPLPDDPGAILPAELAHHFEQGRRFDSRLSAKAVHYQLAAGDQARRMYANPEAVRFYQQALAILKEGNDYEQVARTLMKLGLTHHNAFDFPKARQTYQEAFAYWRHMETAFPKSSPPLSPAPHALRLPAEEPHTLDTTRHPNDSSIDVLRALFSGLVQQGPQLEILPDIAEHWDLLDGGRSYIFHLRQEACWSDGEPVRAADFVAAWRRILDPANPADTPSMLYDIRGAKDFHLGYAPASELGVEALDESTLLVELNDPCGYFLNLMAHTVAYPIPAHQAARFSDDWSQPEHLVTNGAFRLASWRRGEDMLLVRSLGYHGRFGGNVQQVLLSFVLPWSGGLEMYAGDRLDMLDVSFFQPQDLEATRQLYVEDYRCLPRLATGFTGFDTHRPPFDDPRVRRAFALATDRQALASLLRRDQVFPASGGFVPLGMPGHTPGIALPFDPQQARQLLAGAGFPEGRGFPEVISVIPQVTASHVVGGFIREQWGKILNVQITGRARPLDQFHKGEPNPAPHLFNYAWAADYPDPAVFLGASGPLLHTHWHDDNYEDLIEQARCCLDQEQRMRIYAQAERILAAAAPLIPLFYMRRHLLVKPWVRKLPGGGGNGSTWKEVILEPHP